MIAVVVVVADVTVELPHRVSIEFDSHLFSSFVFLMYHSSSFSPDERLHGV